jgi:hypothetical protein
MLLSLIFKFPPLKPVSQGIKWLSGFVNFPASWKWFVLWREAAHARASSAVIDLHANSTSFSGLKIAALGLGKTSTLFSGRGAAYVASTSGRPAVHARAQWLCLRCVLSSANLCPSSKILFLIAPLCRLKKYKTIPELYGPRIKCNYNFDFRLSNVQENDPAAYRNLSLGLFCDNRAYLFGELDLVIISIKTRNL